MGRLGSWLARRRILAVAVVAMAALGLVLSLVTVSFGAANVTSFKLYPNKAVKSCAQAQGQTAKALVTVTRGAANDTLSLTLSGFKPNLAFDMFTVQHSPQLANGDPDPSFTNFGLAWYQSEVPIDQYGMAKVKVKTILLDEIFGFDPAASLTPVNTFHVGFWFDDPADAAPCGFTGTTPFNGTHDAGPVAFISRPNAVTGLGPLCTKSSCP
jgi:hypothetical protein